MGFISKDSIQFEEVWNVSQSSVEKVNLVASLYKLQNSALFHDVHLHTWK